MQSLQVKMALDSYKDQWPRELSQLFRLAEGLVFIIG